MCADLTPREIKVVRYRFQRKYNLWPIHQHYYCRKHHQLIALELDTILLKHNQCIRNFCFAWFPLQIQSHTTLPLHVRIAINFRVWHLCALYCYRGAIKVQATFDKLLFLSDLVAYPCLPAFKVPQEDSAIHNQRLGTVFIFL